MPTPAKEPVADTPTLHVTSRDVPPGAFSYKIMALSERAPGIAWVGPFNDTATLLAEVNRRERANGVSPSSLAAIENQICHRLPPGYCRDDTNRPTTTPGALSLGLGDVITGTRALVGWFRHGSVDLSEIERRTRICNVCPENQPILGCQGCAASKLHSVMNAIVVRPLATDALLHACNVCKCSLKAKVRFKLDDLPPLTADQRARLPETCWIVAEPSLRDSDLRT